MKIFEMQWTNHRTSMEDGQTCMALRDYCWCLFIHMLRLHVCMPAHNNMLISTLVFRMKKKKKSTYQVCKNILWPLFYLSNNFFFLLSGKDNVFFKWYQITHLYINAKHRADLVSTIYITHTHSLIILSHTQTTHVISLKW